MEKRDFEILRRIFWGMWIGIKNPAGSTGGGD
jgi:hypothetical protein